MQQTRRGEGACSFSLSLSLFPLSFPLPFPAIPPAPLPSVSPTPPVGAIEGEILLVYWAVTAGSISPQPHKLSDGIDSLTRFSFWREITNTLEREGGSQEGRGAERSNR